MVSSAIPLWTKHFPDQTSTVSPWVRVPFCWALLSVLVRLWSGLAIWTGRMGGFAIMFCLTVCFILKCLCKTVFLRFCCKAVLSWRVAAKHFCHEQPAAKQLLVINNNQSWNNVKGVIVKFGIYISTSKSWTSFLVTFRFEVSNCQKATVAVYDAC